MVIVGWNDSTSRVSSVTDTKGNVYQLAVGPTILSGTVSQSIYYAKNIATAAGGNTVTIKFNAAAAYPDIRILEYSGIDPVNPVDAVVAATEDHSTISSSGTIATTNAKDLLVGANMVTAETAGAGIDFTERLYSSPDGDIAEDRVVSGAGLYSASAPLTGPCPWLMQMVAFRAAGVQPPDTTPPTVSIASPKAGATLTGAVDGDGECIRFWHRRSWCPTADRWRSFWDSFQDKSLHVLREHSAICERQPYHYSVRL